MKRKITLNFKSKFQFGGLLTALLLSASSLVAVAQTITTTIGSGTNTTEYLPINGYYGYSYTQQIYLASEFDAAVVGQVNQITKIRFFNESGSLENSESWTVYLGATANSSFASNSSWIPVSSMTQVYSGTLSSPAANSWVEITLTTPFMWDGVSNIVVGIDENSNSYASDDIFWRSYATGPNRAMRFSDDSTNPNPASPPNGQTRYAFVPQVQFEHQLALPCTGTPNHVNAQASNTNLCSNSNTAVNLSQSSSTFATGLSYQWQYNTGNGWSNYAGGTTALYTVTPTESISVRLVTTCVASQLADTSGTASITVNVAPSISLNESAIAYCAGSPTELVATGATTYAWSPAVGLNVTNSDIVLASPANSTTYSVIGTSLEGCKDTATVLVSPLNKVHRSTVYSPTALCSPGTAVTVVSTVTPANIANGGAYEYRFLDVNGTVVQNWSAVNTYAFTPTTDSIYKVFADFRSTTCPDGIDSIETLIPVGFGGAVSVVNYDCLNVGGSATLSSVFGQTQNQTMFTNSFSSTSDITGATLLSGTAAVSGGRVVLTPSQTSAIGSLTINDPSIYGGLNNAMTVSFKMTADMPINTYGTGGADGISYSFGNDVNSVGNQNGSGSKLRLSFDANDNSPNATGIYLAYNLSGVMTPTGSGVLAYVNNITSWKIKQDVQVVLTINTFGKASLTLDGVTIFENVQMPAAYMTANTSGWKHVFGAATGGDAMRQAISHVQISAPIMKYAITSANNLPTAWQNGQVFSNIQPGTYDIWISSNGGTSCAKKVKTIQILNTNPLVQLGADTTICEGQSIVLDAGNPGSSYVWSNTQAASQTLAVSNPGSYVVNVTAPNGCVGVGSINVDVLGDPTAGTIYVQNNMPSYTFTILNPQNANQYSWNFGDGTIITNAPGTVSHTYTATGPYQVSVTLTNECGSETVVQPVVVTSLLSVSENTIEGLNVYPNPSKEFVTIALPYSESAQLSIFDTKGSLIELIDNFTNTTTVVVNNWKPGMYFFRVQTADNTSIVKAIVE